MISNRRPLPNSARADRVAWVAGAAIGVAVGAVGVARGTARSRAQRRRHLCAARRSRRGRDLGRGRDCRHRGGRHCLAPCGLGAHDVPRLASLGPRARSSGGPWHSSSASSSPGSGFGMRRGHERAAEAAALADRSRLRVERLQALAASLSAALTPEQVARVMVEGVPAAIGARGGALGLLDGDELVIVDPVGASGQTLVPGSRMPLTTRAPITTAAREGTPTWVERRRDFVSRFADGAALAPYASGALAVPVFMGDRLVGAMGFPFAEPDAVTVEVRTVARMAADLGGQALERAELYAQERDSREALDRILAVAPRFQHGATPEAVAASVCEEARRAFGCDVAQVWTPLDDDALVVTWRDPPSESGPCRDKDRLRELSRPDRRNARPALDVRARRAGAHTGRGAPPRATPRLVFVTPDPDRDRSPVRQDPDAPVGARDPGAGAVDRGGGTAVRRPGGSRDRTGGAASRPGADTFAAGRYPGARSRGHPGRCGLGDRASRCRRARSAGSHGLCAER